MMDYRVLLVESEEGFAASCPSLKGCHSQGKTREEARANISSAIEEWLAAEQHEQKVFHVTEEIVSV